MVVRTNLHMGLGIVRGDVFPLRRVISGIPSAITISSAKLTLKTTLSDADPGLWQLSATVEDAGSSGTGTIRFDITSTQTLLMVADTPYYFDIQVTLSSGTILTPETGVTEAIEQVTVS